jgi:glycosyltransferase involved in cell wall biosynthesis
MTEVPLVTVLMPVYNGERYLREAIDSILKQTYTEFEFLIINDGSTDKSVNVIQSYNDRRIRLVHNGGNIKLIATLNRGLELAQGKYIARMDCDDISLPERLKEQVEFMEKNRNIGICGTWVKTLVSGLRLNVRYPTEPEEIKAQMLFRIAIAHPSVMMRASFIKQYKLQYNSTYLHAEDYELWNRCSLLFPLANIPKVLLKYRINRNGISQKQRDTQNQTVKQIYKDNFKRLGIDYKEEYGKVHFLVGVPRYPQNENFSEQAERWLLQIYEANKTAQCYDNDILSRIIGERWLAACAITRTGLFKAWRRFSGSPINSLYSFTYGQKIRLVLFHFIRQSGLGNQFIHLMRI